MTYAVTGTGDVVGLNAKMAEILPVITDRKYPPADREAWLGVPGKMEKVYGTDSPVRV